MAKLTDDAGETSGKIPRPCTDFGNDHVYNGLRTRQTSHTIANSTSACVGSGGGGGSSQSLSSASRGVLTNFLCSADRGLVPALELMFSFGFRSTRLFQRRTYLWDYLGEFLHQIIFMRGVFTKFFYCDKGTGN
ncbi:unnamed protein product [Protopolystoma xenopodis]|uniref:RUN domain-containing protein n=1 Tax=Protopolystoma xenopodis TaxID=117903 RepID=A0A3S5AHR5_9PLAT|nr:unnamed protein product [Protopolystoma xenopodis]